MLFTQRFLVLLAALSLTAPLASAEEFNWSGTYAGVSIGQRQVDVDWSTEAYYTPSGAQLTLFPGAETSFDNSAAHLNGFVGYNWQFFPKVLLGLELNIGSASNENESNPIPGVEDNAPIGTYIKTEAGLDASLRARAGYLVTPTVNLYGSVGFAMQKVEATAGCDADTDFCNPSEGNIKNSESDTLNGWVIGFGVETALAQNILIRAEYSYADYGDHDFSGLPFNFNSYGFTSKNSYTSQTLALGVGYSF